VAASAKAPAMKFGAPAKNKLRKWMFRRRNAAPVDASMPE
jgi:hypothetical protein